MSKWRLLLLLGILLSISYVNAESNATPPFIYHSVNVITGEYCEAQTDLELQMGSRLFSLRRYFSSSDPTNGWLFNHPYIYNSANGDLPETEGFKYEYDSKHRLVAVKAMGDQGLGWVRFEYQSNECRVTTSDNQTLTYLFSDTELIEVKRAQDTICNYRYAPIANGKKSVVKREEANGYFVETEYYAKGHKEAGKVKEQRAPLSTDSTPITLNRFNYLDHATEVYDALEHKTTYRYNDKRRLVAIEQFDERGQLYRVEKFFWDPSKENPQLISRAVGDGSGNIRICRTFAYNQHDDLTQETLYGNLSGKCPSAITVQENGIPLSTGVEKYCTYYEYTKEVPYHLLKQSEDNGTSIQYQYTAGRRTGKLICDSSGIKIRNFYTYDSTGNLTQTCVDDGNSPDPQNLSGVTESHNSTGRDSDSIQYTYDAKGRVSSLTDAAGNRTQYTYDASNNPVAIEKQTANKTERQTFTYDYLNRVIQTSETAEDGRILSTSYQYDYLGNRTTSIDSLGNATCYTYDFLNRLLTTISPEVLDSDNSCFQPIEKREYNLFNHLTAVTDGNSNTTRTTYNARGKPIEIIYSDGTKEHLEYNLDGSLAKMVSRQGITNIYITDFLGRVIKGTTFDAEGRLFTEINSSYSAWHLLQTTDAEGRTISYTYDSAGRQVGESSTHSKIQCSFDDKGELYATKHWFGEGSSDYTLQITEHDQNGTLTETRIEDANGTLFKRLFPSSLTQDIPSCVYTPTTNDRGQCVWQITSCDASGCIIITTLDATNRIESLVKKNNLGEVLEKQEIRYDGANNKTRETHLSLSAKEENQKEFTILWRYGPENRLLSITEAAYSPRQRTTSYTYDHLGRLSSVSKTDGVTLFYTYDALNRTATLSSSDQSIEYIYQYDSCHRITQVIDPLQGTVSVREYGANNQLTSETLANGLSLSNEFDLQGRRTQLRLPDGSTVSYNYNAAYLTSISRSGSKNYTHKYTSYDLKGNLLASEMINGLGAISHIRDADDRIIGIETPFWKESLNSFQNKQLSAWTIQDTTGATSYTCEYDGKSQVQGETGKSTHQYSYDSLGNRLSKDETSCTVDDYNRLIRCDNSDYTYNRNGCLIKKTTGKEITHYKYDALNRLTQILAGDHTIQFTYDAFGRRIKQTVTENDTVTSSSYLYDGNNEIGCFSDQTQTFSELRILGLGVSGSEIGAAISIEIDNHLYAPIHDHRGSVSCLIDAETQEIAECYHYTVFGEESLYDSKGELLETSLTNNPWRFSSKRLDPHTGWVWFGKRDYDPHLGRWTTPDPLGFADGINRYAFLQNNPLAYSDLHGLFSFSSIWNSIVDAVKSTVDKVVNTTKDVLHFFWDHLSQKKFQKGFDNLAEEYVGRIFLGLAGYYMDSPETGCHGSKELSNVRITAINGILNLREHCLGAVDVISKTHGNANVHYVFHPTEGWTWDVIKGALAKFGFTSSRARMLADHWKRLIQEMGGPQGGGTIIHYAHSIGGTHTILAKDLLTPEEQRMIQVITLGSATIIPDTGFGSVVNYISKRDAVSFFADPISYLKSHFDPSSNVMHVGSYYGIPLVDHLLSMETYRRVIETLGEQFVKRYS